MRPSSRKRPVRKSYHHGDLRAALVATAKQLIAERGVEGFTLREAARRVGVSHVAAYRHFAESRSLLAAVAEHGFRRLGERLGAARKSAAAALEPQLRAILAAYLRFCWEEPALTEVMFGPRISRGGTFPDLEAAVEESLGTIAEAIAAHAPPAVLRERSPRQLGIVLWTFVHGFATLSHDKAAYPNAAEAAAAFDDALTPMLVGMFGGTPVRGRGVRRG
jgi:AcrR family transcriptional regulator